MEQGLASNMHRAQSSFLVSASTLQNGTASIRFHGLRTLCGPVFHFPANENKAIDAWRRDARSLLCCRCHQPHPPRRHIHPTLGSSPSRSKTPSMNPYSEFTCLYTSQKLKKAKTWQDGTNEGLVAVCHLLFIQSTFIYFYSCIFDCNLTHTRPHSLLPQQLQGNYPVMN